MNTPSTTDPDRPVSVADLLRREGYDPAPELERNAQPAPEPAASAAGTPQRLVRRWLIAGGAAVAGSVLAAVLVVAVTGRDPAPGGELTPAAPPVAGPTAAPAPAPSTGLPDAETDPPAPDTVNLRNDPEATTTDPALPEPEATAAPQAQPSAPPASTTPAPAAGDADGQDTQRGSDAGSAPPGRERSAENRDEETSQSRSPNLVDGLTDTNLVGGLTDTVGGLLGGG